MATTTPRGSQAEVIALLASPDAHGGAPVERVETHASIVFLAGDRAYKLKRAVRYDYLDFSTLERRRQCCEAELRINRRAAPSLYRRVVPVTREVEGHLALDGAGTPVEWLVESRRFDQSLLFDRLAARGALDPALMRPLGAAVAAFHAGADVRRDHGGAGSMAWVLDGNAAALRADASGALDAGLVATLVSASRAALQRDGTVLDRRRADGSVRQCHGDLHLGNLVLLDGQPTLFDAIEFNDELSCVDVFYDLAFLLMDLWQRRLPSHANAVFNGYLAATADFDGLALLPLFLSARAAIRAKTQLTAAVLADSLPRQRELRESARGYLAQAAHLLRPSRPSLVAIGGLSGTGKSTLARALAPSLGPAPGAVVLRSDELRKRMCGVPELSPLGPQGYTAEVSRMVYDTLVSHAAAIVRAGHTAIVDAVYMDPADRTALEQAAARAGVPFAGLWLEAAEPVLIDRIARRAADASDADPSVIRMQCARDPGTITWARIDAGGDVADVQTQAVKRVHAVVLDGIRLAA
jgi:aminoglycoside phosphotransferase family enzyme/predicted kinase